MFNLCLLDLEAGYWESARARLDRLIGSFEERRSEQLGRPWLEATFRLTRLVLHARRRDWGAFDDDLRRGAPLLDPRGVDDDLGRWLLAAEGEVRRAGDVRRADGLLRIIRSCEGLRS